jgi:hypothetical protein
MFDRVSASGYGAVSALWNLAYDAGMGFGAAGFGVLAGHTSYPAAFALTSLLMLAALAPARYDRTHRGGRLPASTARRGSPSDDLACTVTASTPRSAYRRQQ